MEHDGALHSLHDTEDSHLRFTSKEDFNGSAEARFNRS
jgi:hypothetical protein